MLPLCSVLAGPELVFVDMDWIKARKEELKLIILAHNYQRPEVQDVADILGDSLALRLSVSYPWAIPTDWRAETGLR